MRSLTLALALSISLASIASAQTSKGPMDSRYAALVQADKACTAEGRQYASWFTGMYSFALTKHQKNRRLVACMQKKMAKPKDLVGRIAVPTDR